MKGNKKLNNADIMILDDAKVAGLVFVKEEFFEKGKMSWVTTPIINNHIEIDISKITYDIDKEKILIRKTLISSNYIDWFIKILKGFYENNKIKPSNLRYYIHKTKKDYPCLIVYNNLGMILAPRVGDE